MHVSKDRGNDEARPTFSSRDKPVSFSVDESAMSELEMPWMTRQGRKMLFTFNFLINRCQVSFRMRYSS